MPDKSDLQNALDTIRDRIQYLGVRRPADEHRRGFIDGLKIVAAIIEGIQQEHPTGARTGNYGNAQALKDEEVPRS